MTYTYELQRSAERYLVRLTSDQRVRIFAALERICEDPFDSARSIPLKGRMTGHRRTRVGGIRIIFKVIDDRLLVYVTAIGPRGDIYKG